MTYQEKCKKLNKIMEQYASHPIVVAFSGGIDSSLLLKLAVEQSEKYATKVYAVTANTELHPMCDLEIATSVAKEIGAIHKVLSVNELQEADILDNPVDRCYRCKHFLFEKILTLSKELQAPYVIDGTNIDDTTQYRPGIKALTELGIKSPLKEAGFTKKEVRQLASEYNISVANRPSTPCLATRFPYGTHLFVEDMKRVEAGENYLRRMGFYNVRIRVHGNLCRIEVGKDQIPMLLTNQADIIATLKQLGYHYITLDLEGFRSGSMDIEIEK